MTIEQERDLVQAVESIAYNLDPLVDASVDVSNGLHRIADALEDNNNILKGRKDESTSIRE